MKRAASSSRPSSRTQRKRKVAERVKKVDSKAIHEAKLRLLNNLEDDNYAEEAEAAALAGEPEYDPGADSDEGFALGVATLKKTPKKRGRSARGASASKGKSKAKAGIERWNKTLAQALEEEDVSKRPPGMAKYDAIAAKPSIKPPRPFCSVCGYHAAYTCTRCYTRFCSIPCGNLHNETRCLKYTT